MAAHPARPWSAELVVFQGEILRSPFKLHLTALALLTLAACGDSGSDATADAGDAAGDVADASDAVDTADTEDGEADAASDTTDVDTVDTAADVAELDGDAVDPVDLWAHCPAAAEFVGDSEWQQELVATDNAVYCATFNEGRTLIEELQAKAMLRVVPGDYRLPTTDGEANFYLPLCLSLGDGAAPLTNGTGSITHTASTFDGRTYHRNPFVLELDSGRIEGSLDPVQVGELAPMVLDGRPHDLFGETDTFAFNQCAAAGECWGQGSRAFDSCTYEGVAPQFHHMVLDGGEVHFELRIGQSPASTEPGAFVRAWGEYGGVDFDQTDYWHLVYNPTHHHFERDFAVFFDEPIDGACGLEVINLEPWDDYTADAAFEVDCELNRLAEVEVISGTWERTDP
jgi:hypothetical protein